MTTAKVSEGEKAERKLRAEEWKRFRQTSLITQRKLAERLGLSRRTIQQIEAAQVTPHISTLRRFDSFRQLHEREAKFKRQQTKEWGNGGRRVR